MKRWTKAAALFLALAFLLGLGAFAVSEAEAAELFAGRWTDKENGMEMEVKYSGSAFSIEITAPTEKADVRLIWLIAGLYSEEDGAVVYEGCLWGERTYTSGDQYTDNFRDSDKQGFFKLDGSRIVWHQKDGENETLLRFDRAEAAADQKPSADPKPSADTPPAAAAAKIPFTDVKQSDYFYDAVVWCYANKITAGVSETSFDPQGTVTRAQVVSFLWRMAGQPAPKNSDMVFVDVEIGSWYEKAVQWAVAEGVTVGTGEGCFSPFMNCTRGQVVTFLYRMFGEPKPSGLGAYTDVPANEYYAAAVNWATEKGIITDPTKGSKKDTFVPMGDAKRQDMIVFLYEAAKLSKDDVEPDKPEPEIRIEPHPAADFLGSWAEKIAGRGVVTFTEYGGGNYLVNVIWSDSAYVTYNWSIFATYQDGKMSFSDARKWHRTYTSETEYWDEVDYTGGVGYFCIEDGLLVWIIDKGDVDASARFVKLEV